MNNSEPIIDRKKIARDWLPRYTGMPIDQFGDYILLTNFDYYMQQFAKKFDCKISVSYTHLTLPTTPYV